MNRFQTILTILLCVTLSGCTAPARKNFFETAPPLGHPLPTNENGLPELSVYIKEANDIQRMDLETYVCGVVAGEMKNDWPLEALRAQAILARTFVLKFVTEKQSQYSGADISTDIAEAQAYDASAVNERIREAVASTAGLVLLTKDDKLPYTWFHAHSGGQTALAKEGIDWQESEPPYIVSREGLDSPNAPASAQTWSARFSEEDFLAACRKVGAQPVSIHDLRIAQKGESGRAITLWVDGYEVNAARLRIALGSTVMRSTLLTKLVSDGRSVIMAGRGYGHGVGMPQWGAYALAEDGFSGEEIALHYYKDLRLVRLWNEVSIDRF